MKCYFRPLTPGLFITIVQLILATTMLAQTPAPPSGATPDAPLTLTLQDALQRARANSAQFQSALTDLGVATEERVQARAALLPNVNYTTQYVYTEGNGTPSGRFIANNAVHEYVAQGTAHQVFGLTQAADFHRAGAQQAVARAKADIAARGLVVTVVQNYYGLIVAQRKYANTQQAAAEAQHFLQISQQLEKGGEVAHSDVIKAQLQFNDRQRDLSEAQLAMNKARLQLAVLLFPDFRQDFSVVDDLRLAPALPSFNEAQQLAARNNPQIRAATAALAAAHQETVAAWGGHLPTLTLDYFYGIDATHFAVRTDGIRNLGYAATASLNLPVWNWGATQSKVRVAEYRQRQARIELSQTQRELLANLRSFYDEAQTVRNELDALRSSADLAVESLRLTALRYQGGEATALELVDAQNALTAARNAYDDGDARYRVALANLQTLTGTF